ncbi:hypothetical protein LCGC14_1803860 [marine sediment metagenome]|uniref:DUF7483 domain-containing protein n=1 Tax=marine sediment metagenome TaxID=412755 RepID=A0A0F9GNX3_9ZZZZ
MYSSPGQALFDVGFYTGDGAASKSITGVGFRPRAVIIQSLLANSDSPILSFWSGNAFIVRTGAGASMTSSDTVISLDGDGFTVGDGSDVGVNSANAAQNYRYVCFG